MTQLETKPTDYLRLLRQSFFQLIQPGHALSIGEIMSLQKQINNCYEVTRDMEEEFDYLSNVALPEVKIPARERPSANVVPLRRKPRFQMVSSSPDGGDAA